MPYIHPDVLDGALNVIVNASAKVLHLCSAQPTDFSNVASVTLGNKTNPTVSNPQARSPSGRRIEIAAFTDGSTTASGTATHWAITDGSRLLATSALAAPVPVTSGETFVFPAFSVGFPDLS